MLKKIAWLLLAGMILGAGTAQAQAPKAGTAAKPTARAAKRAAAPQIPEATEAPARKAAAQRQEIDVKPIPPDSTPRMLAPDQYPSNVVKILRTTNKAQTNTYVPVVFDFKNTNPFNAVRFLHRPVQQEEGQLFTFVNDKGDGGKALFVVPDYMVPSLTDLVATVDRKDLTSSAGDKYVYMQLRHRRADITDPTFLATAESYTTGDGDTFIVDPEENALFVKDAPSGATNFETQLHDVADVPTAMLDLYVKVYEIDATNDAQIGLDYMAWKNGPGANLFAAGAFAERGSAHIIGLPKASFDAKGYNFAYRYDVPSAYFDFLTVRGKARILNEMKLSALNTRPATLTAGDQVLYYAVNNTDPSGIRDTGKPFQANQGRTVVGTTVDKKLVPVETGLKLSVTPIIGEQEVLMNVGLDWSDYSFTDDTGTPQINKRALTSTLRGKIGEEIILGGLARQSIVKATRKVPVLGSIPILGYAFGGETSTTRKSELVVVITPAAVFKYNLAKTAQEVDYYVSPSEMDVMHQASGDAPVPVPNAKAGFNQLGLDKE